MLDHTITFPESENFPTAFTTNHSDFHPQVINKENQIDRDQSRSHDQHWISSGNSHLSPDSDFANQALSHHKSPPPQATPCTSHIAAPCMHPGVFYSI